MKFYSALLTHLLFLHPVFAGPVIRPAMIDNQPSTKLFEVEVPESVTTMLYSTDSRPFKGTMVLYGGLGAKSFAYGIGASMGHIANKALKENFEPFAFQNPLYYHDDADYAERLRLVGKFRDLDAQLDWMAETLRASREQAKNSERFIVGGRSTGAALLLEAYHRYLAYGAYADIFSRVDELLIMGTVDPRAFAHWHAKERAFLDSRKQIFDEFAFDSEPFLYPSMKYLTEAVVVPKHQRLAHLTFVAGTNDEFNPLHEQVDVAKTFSRTHAGLSVDVIVTDTSHNPAASVTYLKNGAEVKVRTMKRLSPILEKLLNDRTARAPGLRLQINPEVSDCQLLIEGELVAAE